VRIVFWVVLGIEVALYVAGWALLEPRRVKQAVRTNDSDSDLLQHKSMRKV
jgi:hypothetical protein